MTPSGLILQDAISDMSKLIDIVKIELKDTNLPLALRWEMFKAFSSYLPHSSFYINLDYGNEEIVWYDIGVEKYATCYLSELPDRFEGCTDDSEEEEDRKINELKEDILQLGIGSFENDW